MKGGGGGSGEKTKVVVRRLPPTLSQAALMAQIDVVFTGRYSWVSFRPGKPSQKHQSYSRAYIDFKKAEDVIEFAEFFNGHMSVNEKGTQYKAVVEYAPSQRVPKHWSKKDGREGTIHKDPEYLEFLEFISKPMENLPSAEIQLERREAEKSTIPKDAPIITPLMDFIRQKRAAKSGSRRILSNGKLNRRAGTARSPGSSSSKRGSEKKTMSSTMYVMRDTAKGTGGKDRSTHALVPKRDNHQLSDKVVKPRSTSGFENMDGEKGIPGITDTGKKKIALLKGKGKEKEKEKEVSPVSGRVSLHQRVTSSDKNVTNLADLKQNQRHEPNGRVIRSILLNKDAPRNQTSGVHSEHQSQISNMERERRPPQAPHVSRESNGISDEKIAANDLHGLQSDKQEKRTRNRDRTDRVVWTPLRRSDGSFTGDESLSLSTSQSTQSGFESLQGDAKVDTSTMRSGEFKILGSGHGGHSSLDNGEHKPFGRRGPANILRDSDGSAAEGKPPKRGSNSSYEKQVWVQKSSSGS